MANNELNIVVVKFDNAAQAETFMDWLNNSGEQDYFDVQDFTDEPAENFVNSFDYDYGINTIVGKTV